MRRLTYIVAAWLTLVLAADATGAVVWPTVWKTLTIGGSAYTDPANDVNPARVDIVGDATFPAAYWFYDPVEGNLMFRMRISGNPSPTSAAWQVLLQTDGDSGMDWALQVDESGSNVVELVQATTEGPTFADVVIAGTGAWTGALSTYRRFVFPTGDGSNFEGNTDAWVDMAIPWASFSSVTGVSLTDSFQLGVSSSTTHTQINKDYPLALSSTSSVSAAFSDPIKAVPEPSGFLLTALGLAALLVLLRRRGTRSTARRAVR